MSHSAEKCKRGDPLGFVNIYSVAKYQKTLNGDCFETLKNYWYTNKFLMSQNSPDLEFFDIDIDILYIYSIDILYIFYRYILRKPNFRQKLTILNSLIVPKNLKEGTLWDF